MARALLRPGCSAEKLEYDWKHFVGDEIAGKDLTMLWTIFVVLLILWLLGMVSSYTIGGFIHILLVIALVMLLINLITGRRPVV